MLEASDVPVTLEPMKKDTQVRFGNPKLSTQISRIPNRERDASLLG